MHSADSRSQERRSFAELGDVYRISADFEAEVVGAFGQVIDSVAGRPG